MRITEHDAVYGYSHTEGERCVHFPQFPQRVCHTWIQCVRICRFRNREMHCRGWSASKRLLNWAWQMALTSLREKCPCFRFTSIISLDLNFPSLRRIVDVTGAACLNTPFSKGIPDPAKSRQFLSSTLVGGCSVSYLVDWHSVFGSIRSVYSFMYISVYAMVVAISQPLYLNIS